MEVVQEADNTEALIKLEMVIVMELRREEEWQVVSGVGVDGGDEGEAIPGPGSDQVTAQQQGTQSYREQVRERVLERVRVERGQTQGRAPLVMNLVHTRVEGGAVEGQVRVEEAKLLHQEEHGDLSNNLQRWRELPGPVF